MGQYWEVYNLDKKEYLNPHKLGCGLKLREQLGTHPGTGSALLLLCAAMPIARGGGDFSKNSEASKKVIGRWAGDRIALIGDYAEKSDPISIVNKDEYVDISDQVVTVLEEELEGKFSGDGWKRWKYNDE